MMRMRVMQHQRKTMQWRIAKTFGFDRLDGREHIVAVDARLAVALQDMAELLVKRQPAGILHMAPIDHVSERADALPRVVLEPHRAHHLAIDGCDLLARAQIRDGSGTVCLGDTEG